MSIFGWTLFEKLFKKEVKIDHTKRHSVTEFFLTKAFRTWSRIRCSPFVFGGIGFRVRLLGIKSSCSIANATAVGTPVSF